MVYLTRRERFNAAHRLFREEWDDKKNFEVFGKCSNPNWHGHNYELFVTVNGTINSDTGFVINLKTLSAIIKKLIIDKVDHKNMNLEVDFMKGIIPTTENMAVAFWNQLEKPVRRMGAQLHCVKIVETENNFAEYFGG